MEQEERYDMRPECVFPLIINKDKLETETYLLLTWSRGAATTVEVDVLYISMVIIIMTQDALVTSCAWSSFPSHLKCRHLIVRPCDLEIQILALSKRARNNFSTAVFVGRMLMFACKSQRQCQLG